MVQDKTMVRKRNDFLDLLTMDCQTWGGLTLNRKLATQTASRKAPSQKSKPTINWKKARFNRDEYNFNGINWDLSEILP